MIIDIHVEAATATVRNDKNEVIFQYHVNELSIVGDINKVMTEIQNIVAVGLANAQGDL